MTHLPQDENNTFSVQECQVQNTAREYIKAYTTAAQSTEAFGEIPEWVTLSQTLKLEDNKTFFLKAILNDIL